jgi:hypothetical protein
MEMLDNRLYLTLRSIKRELIFTLVKRVNVEQYISEIIYLMLFFGADLSNDLNPSRYFILFFSFFLEKLNWYYFSKISIE